MIPDQWQKAKNLFDAAMKRPPDERLRFLDENFDGDEAVRREVASLLANAEDAAGFLEHPAVGEVAKAVVGSREKLRVSQSLSHYKIIKLLGAGGMGEVYLANDKKLDRQVAVKILNEKFAKHESNLQRFIQEAKAASALNHPNILVIHEIGESEDAYYIVSEFIKGKTLREILKEKTLNLSEVLDIAIQIVNALTAAHEAHIVHRDIKPENIMIRPDGYVKILDFGLAKLVEQKTVGFEDITAKQNETAKGIILGTVNYMSPEQAKSEKVDERTDIFSFGAVVYEMVAGRTPFAGDSVSETFANLINSEPLPLSRYTTNLPEELQRIVAKMLCKNKDERYQMMKDVLTDLRDLRENLAFDERLEKSHSPSDENATAILQATTDDANKRTDETNYNFTAQIKRHRFRFAAFAVLIILALGSLGIYLWRENEKSVANARIKTIAVLPFKPLVADNRDEALEIGMADTLIARLGNNQKIIVRPLSSVRRFGNLEQDAVQAGRALDVEAVLDGSIQRWGDGIRVNVRLIRVADGTALWTGTFDEKSTGIFVVQDAISNRVASALAFQLSGEEQKRLTKRYTENVEAYGLYLKGRYHAARLTPPETNKGISYFQQAVELDPNYALAYVGLARAYQTLPPASEFPPTEFFPKAKAAAQKALEIDDRLAEAHAVLGWVLFWYEWDWEAAEIQDRRAIEFNPNSADAHEVYAHLLSNTGRHTEALAEIKRARELDPLYLRINALEGQFLIHAGQTDEALARLQKTVELEPNFWMPHLFASSAYIEKGMYAEAVAEAHKARELSGVQTTPLAFSGYALAKAGRTAEARAVLDELSKLSTGRYVPPYHIALIHNGLGEEDQALTWLERGFEQRDAKMVFLKVEPKWNNLRSEPRFIDLMRRMNFE